MTPLKNPEKKNSEKKNSEKIENPDKIENLEKPPVASPDGLSAELDVSPSAVIKPKNLSFGHKLRNRILAQPRLIQLAIALMLLGGTSALLLYILFRGAWPQHQDNKVILSSILKMELGRDSSRVIDENDAQRVVTRSFSTLESYLAADGWTWINRFGSTITYGKQNQRLIASCSPYSPLYTICDLSEIP
jgi:hypothetical protein